MTGAPAAAIVVLVLLKIAFDLGLHLAEHRGRRRPPRRRARGRTRLLRDRTEPRPWSGSCAIRGSSGSCPVTPSHDLAGGRAISGRRARSTCPTRTPSLWSDIPQQRGASLVRGRGRPANSTGRPTSRMATRSTTTALILACEHGTRRVAPVRTRRIAHDGGRPLRGQAAQLAERPRGRVRRRDLVHRSAVRHPRRPRGLPGRPRARRVLRLPAGPGERRADDRQRRPGPPERPRLLARRDAAVRGGHLGRAHRGWQPPHPRLRRDRRTDGSASPRVFAVIDPGLPDGIRVDVEGNVWTSAGDGIQVLDDRRRPSSGGSSRPRRRATARSAAPMDGGCSSPRRRPCGRSMWASAAR